MRYVKDEFWTDPYTEDLDPSEKLLFLYLITNPLCNCAGIYEIKNKRIAYETGFDKEMVERLLDRFIADKKILRIDDWMIVVNFVKNQANNPSILQGVQRILNSLPQKVIQALTASPQAVGYYTILNLTIPNGMRVELNSKKGKPLGDLVSGDDYTPNGQSPLDTLRNRRKIERALGLGKSTKWTQLIFGSAWDFLKAFKKTQNYEYVGDVMIEEFIKNMAKYYEAGENRESIREMLVAYFTSEKAQSITITPTTAFSQHTYNSWKQGKLRPPKEYKQKEWYEK